MGRWIPCWGFAIMTDAQAREIGESIMIGLFFVAVAIIVHGVLT